MKNTIYIITLNNAVNHPKTEEIFRSLFYVDVEIHRIKNKLIILIPNYNHLPSLKEQIPIGYKKIQQFFSSDPSLKVWLNNNNFLIE